MISLSEFVEKHGFERVGDWYAGTYADMHLEARETDGLLEIGLFLDLPRGGKWTALIQALKEKEERFAALIAEGENPCILKATFSECDCALMERFLSECDTLIRPYGREMGILCAQCRREIHEGEFGEYRLIGQDALPVCSNCVNGKVSRAENRRTVQKKRARGGVLGALTGTLVAAAAWAIVAALGLSGYFIPALGVGFLVNYFYERFGGIDDKWKVWIVAACAIFAVLLGTFIARGINAYQTYLNIAKAYTEESGEALSQEEMSALGQYLKNAIFSSFYSVMDIPSLLLAAIGAVVFSKRR